MKTVVRQFSFDAAHCLPNYDGPCANLHGHTWRLLVEVCGPPVLYEGYSQSDTYPGMVCDFRTMDKIVKELVIDKLDHRYINEIFDGPPLAEVIIDWIVDKLYEDAFGDNLIAVQLYETEKSLCVWRNY